MTYKYPLEEIRINDQYASKIMAQYEDGKRKEESTPVIRQKILRTSTYTNKVLKHLLPNFGEEFLPQNCRFIKQYPTGHTLVIIEEPPAMRSIRVDLDMANEAAILKAKDAWEEYGYKDFFEKNQRPYTFMLAMPYAVHILLISPSNNLSEGIFGFRTNPIVGMQDKLFRAPLLNIDTHLRVCYGSRSGRIPTETISRVVNFTIHAFWESTFNSDYPTNYERYEHTAGVCDYFTWQYYSKTNPLFIYSVNWMAYDQSIGTIISQTERNYKLNSVKGLKYKTLSELFSRATPGKVKKVKKSRIKRKLIYDVCDGWRCNKELLHVGDSFPLNKKGDLAYIESFVSYERSTVVGFLKVVFKEKTLLLKLTKAFSKYVSECVHEIKNVSSITLPDKSVLKAGDIVKMTSYTGKQVFKQLKYIRRAIDDKLEIQLGNDFYFADAIDWKDLQKIETKELKKMDFYFKPKSKFIMLATGQFYKSQIIQAFKAEFSNYNVNSRHQLTAVFKGIEEDNQSDEYRFALGDSMNSYKPIPLKTKDIQKLPHVFFVGRKILCNTMAYDRSKRRTAYKYKNKMALRGFNAAFRTPPFSDLVEHVLKDDTFHIESPSSIIEFKLNDQVVVADWTDPLSVLQVKTIRGFNTNAENKSIAFILENKHGDLENVNYISDSYIFVGRIRKVVTKFEKLESGIKIQAKNNGIYNFPKEDVNIIVAFIVDTHTPLVLCSNGLTLDYQDVIDNFNIIPLKSKKWNSLDHVPIDINKIGLQTGDIVKTSYVLKNVPGFMVVKYGTKVGLQLFDLNSNEYVEVYPLTHDIVNDLVLDCIPTPRIDLKHKKKEYPTIRGFSDLHGTILLEENSQFKFYNDSRRIINV